MRLLSDPWVSRRRVAGWSGPCIVARKEVKVATRDVNLAVFASGRGSNLGVLVARVADGRLPARIAMVLSNDSGSGALAIASRHGIPTAHLSAVTPPEADAYRDAMPRLLESHRVGLIVLAGFMKLVPAQVVARYPCRIVNIHPAPLPRFGGRGMYGLAPHGAVLAAGLPESAVCVHHVTAEYDQGPVIASRPVPICPDDYAGVAAATRGRRRA